VIVPVRATWGQTGRGGSGGDIGNNEWKLSNVNTTVVSKGQNRLIEKFKMVAGNVISIGG